MLFSHRPRLKEFEAAALPHLNDLYRTATRMLGDGGRAEDVLQDVYLQAWKSFDRFETDTNCRAWLYRILFYTIHHYRRKWMSARMVKENDAILETAEAPGTPVPEQITDKVVLAALDRVPEEFRSVVVLVDVEEFSYKDAAGILGVKVGTVMSRSSRGRRLLRESLARLAESYGIGSDTREGRRA